MVTTDSIVTSSPGTAKDLAKKKRTSRAAKLKQCKLDARREQWLSKGNAVKDKGLKVEGSVKNGDRGEPMRDEGKRVLELNNNHNQEISDWDSITSSPTSGSSLLGGADSGMNYRPSSSSSRSFSSSAGCYSGTITDEEENEVDGDDDDGCLEDWETLADALVAEEKQKNAEPEPSPVNVSIVQSDTPNEAMSQTGSALVAKPGGLTIPRAQENRCAWKVDDSSRPQSLPNLSKQHSFPTNSNRHCTRATSVWSCKNVGTTAPPPCPICCEELDTTDTKFCPCPCGFMLCLFCHKKILEQDGRCPGCRKVYNQEAVVGEVSGNGRSFTLRLARSVSMVSRS